MTAAQDSQLRLGEGRPPDLFESKLHPPVAHAALVSRAALVDRLDASDVPITVVAAPPGYGKTTLLAEWSRRHPSRFAWLSIDRHDNDLGRLMSYTAAALDRVDPIGSDVLRPWRPSLGGRRRLTRRVGDVRDEGARRPRPRPCRGARERRVPRHDRRACPPPPGRLAARARDARRTTAPDGTASRRR